MLTKSLIATAALALSLATFTAGNAEAKSHVNLNVGVGIGVGGFYAPGYVGVVPGYIEYDEPYYSGISCGQARNIVKGNGFYNVKSIDCSAPSYKFVAWQGGNKYKVRVNSAGNITGVTPL